MTDNSSSELVQSTETGTTDAGVASGDQSVTGDRQRPKDVVFDLLSAKRRRDVLSFMAENGSETTLSELADHIAALENDTEIRLLSSQQRKRVYVALYQCHLPRMDDAGVIEFENSRGTVELRPAAAELYRYMEITSLDSDESEGTADEPESGRVSSVRSKLGKWVQR
jgi:hypothetical protein